MATANRSVKASPVASPKTRREGYPESTLRFDSIISVLGLILVLGLYQDGWAHNNGQVDNTFFTPWHAILYGSIGITGLFLAVNQYLNVGRGYAWTRALPKGYLLSLLGVGLFFMGGAFDFLWHSLFGFEIGVEALLSPAHLILASAGILIVTGPLRSVAMNRQMERQTARLGWRDGLPVILSLFGVLSAFSFFTQYVTLFSQGRLITAISSGEASYFLKVTVLSYVFIPIFLTMSIVLFGIRRWRLPFGALTLLLGANASLMLFESFNSMGPYWPILIGPFLAGFVGDLLLRRIYPLNDHQLGYRLFASLVPAILMGVPLIYLRLTYGILLTEHLWLGAIFTAGLIGLLLSYLALTPTLDGEAG